MTDSMPESLNPFLSAQFDYCRKAATPARPTRRLAQPVPPTNTDLPWEPPTDSRFTHGQGDTDASSGPHRLHEAYDQFDEGPVVTSDDWISRMDGLGLSTSRMQCSTSPSEYSSLTVHGGIGQDGVVDALKRGGFEHLGTGGTEQGTRHDVLTHDGGRTVAVAATRMIGSAKASGRPITHTTLTFHDAADKRAGKPKGGRDHYSKR
jgi:hypothetical protein